MSRGETSEAPQSGARAEVGALSGSQEAPEKPATGERCNGCGVCCLAMPCGISMRAFGTEPGQRCPVLTWRDGRFWCEAVEMDESGYISWRLGVGVGCDSADPTHVELARRMNKARRKARAA